VARRRPRGRLTLGPVVGHTDHESTRIWIQVPDDPDRYFLRVIGVGLFKFAGTEDGAVEFGTAIVRIDGLESDRSYRYRVVRAGRFVPGGEGSFRTFPHPQSMANLLFCAISCSGAKTLGAWEQLVEFVDAAKPAFILMMGDQVYLDEDEPDAFATHRHSDKATRRLAIANMYRDNWSRGPVQHILANLPTYMIWDDHDIRDGWGSLASDSPTLAERFPRGRAIFRMCSEFFEDTRDIYWHFQGCRNPRPGDSPDPGLPNYIDGLLPPGVRLGMPFAFRCGRLTLLVLDARGERDVFRRERPVLGTRQWQFVDDVLAGLGTDVDALAVVTPTALVSQDPDGQTQRLLGDRTDDIDAFAQGDEEALFSLSSTTDKVELVKSIISANISNGLGLQPNFGEFKLSSIDEARDQWSHRFCRPEQQELLTKSFAARLVQRPPGIARSLLFLSGDLHIGCIFDLSASGGRGEAVSLTSSGISQIETVQPVVGTFVDQEFTAAPGIRATLREVVNNFNFGVVQVQPTGHGAVIQPVLAHEGEAVAWGLEIEGLF